MATKALPAPTARNSITQAGKTIYLNNKELLAGVRESKQLGHMSDTLAKMLMLLCSRYAKKGNFVNYSYNEDMQGYAMMMLVRTWNSFDPEKGSNPFAFFTQCIKNSFIQYLKVEGKQRQVRDALMIDQGLNPSYGYDDDGERGPKIEDEQDFDTMRSVIETQDRTKYTDTPIERDESGSEVIIDLPTPDEPEEETPQL